MFPSNPTRWLKMAATMLGVIAGSPLIALGCPLCKDALQGDPVAAAFNGTTLLMIAAPMLMVASVGGWIAYLYWRAGRRADADRGATRSKPAAPHWPVLREEESQT